MKKNIIKFRAEDDYHWNVTPKPEPASNFLPDWYKKANIYSDGSNKINLNPGPNITFKRCFPLLDSFTSGYISPLFADCQISYTKEFGSLIKWNITKNVFDTWPEDQVSTFEIPDGYCKTVFKYMHGWIPKTPKGYSCLITHPFAYQDLPFRAITGVVDTDKLDTGAYVPIVFKNNWEGILEKGTPMFQIIPFKREKWFSEYEQMKENENFYNYEKLHSKIISPYAKLFREKKQYL
jgi:hypothetical protein